MLIRIFRCLLCIIGLILVADSIVLLSLKKLHLGIILPLLIGSFFLIYSICYQSVNHYIQNHQKIYKFWKIGWTLFSIWLISLVIFFFYLGSGKNQDINLNNLDAIIVLGGGLKNNQPSEALAARLDAAAHIAKAHETSVIVVTGGLGFARMVTEADAMSKYLQEQYQINADRIILEDKSTSTELNLKNSQSLLESRGVNMQDLTVIVTSDFHILRSLAIAKKLGYQNVVTYSAETPLLIRYNAWLREYFAYISGWILSEY